MNEDQKQDPDLFRIPCGEGEIVLGGPAPKISSTFFKFEFGPAPSIDDIDGNLENKSEPKIIIGSPCPPLQKIHFEKEKNDNAST